MASISMSDASLGCVLSDDIGFRGSGNAVTSVTSSCYKRVGNPKLTGIFFRPVGSPSLLLEEAVLALIDALDLL